MYVKSTQTDMVYMETRRNDGEEEDDSEVELQPVSSQPTATPTEAEKVLLVVLLLCQV